MDTRYYVSHIVEKPSWDLLNVSHSLTVDTEIKEISQVFELVYTWMVESLLSECFTIVVISLCFEKTSLSRQAVEWYVYPVFGMTILQCIPVIFTDFIWSLGSISFIGFWWNVLGDSCGPFGNLASDNSMHWSFIMVCIVAERITEFGYYIPLFLS